MNENNALPKAARDQMARQQRSEAASHPDADVLTAFCEGLLPERERARVSNHIATCAECREIVFLSAPETLAAPTTVLAEPRSVNWWRRFMPAAVAAVALVVVGSAVLLHRTGQEHLQKATVPPAQPQVTQSQTTPAESAQPDQKGSASADNGPSQERTPVAAPRRTAPAGVVGGIVGPSNSAASSTPGIGVPMQQQATAAGPHGSITPKGSATNYQYLAVAPAPPPPPPVGPTASGKYGPVQAAGNSRNYDLGSNVPTAVTVARPAAPAATDKVASARQVQKAETVHAEANSLADAQAAIGGPVQTKTALAAAPAELARADLRQLRAHWRISDTGQLQRRIGTYPWAAVLADEKAKFRIVAVIGNDVWVGGTAGALYHSGDAGQQWTKLPIGTNETITAIDFRDARSGTVRTESGTTWQTADGGDHWTRK